MLQLSYYISITLKTFRDPTLLLKNEFCRIYCQIFLKSIEVPASEESAARDDFEVETVSTTKEEGLENDGE